MLAVACLGAFTLSGCGALVQSAPPLHATFSPSVPNAAQTPATGAPLYSSPLTSASTPNGWTTNPVCHFTPQGLVVRPSNGQAYICLAPAPAVADVSISVTAQQLSGPPDHAFGIALRHNDPKSYYFFGIDGHGRYTFAIVVDDVSHTVVPFTASAAVHAGMGATNTLRVVAKGTALTLFANGVALGQVTASTFARGTIGLRGIDGGDVRFTQLTIARI